MDHRTCFSFLRNTNLLVLLVGLAASFTIFSSGHAYAAAVGCRHDPIVTLSNGDIVTISVDLDADYPTVKKIEYKLHVPKGVTAASIVYQDANPNIQEKIDLPQDAKVGQYLTETKVEAPKSVQVVVTSQYNTQSLTVNGKGGDNLKATLLTSASQ